MNQGAQSKPDGVDQKRVIVSNTSETVALHAGLSDPNDLPLHKAAVAAAVYHYTVGIYRSSEIAGRVRLDSAFAAWRKHGSPTAEDLVRVRDEQGELLRRCLAESLSWSWNVALRSQVTGEATVDYARRVVAGRQEQFRSQSEVAAEVNRRIEMAAAEDLEPQG